MKMKKLLVVVALIFVTVCSYGQIITFEFSALGGAEASAVSNFNDANLTASTITRGAGLTASANGGRFNATNWATTSIANAVAGNNYMEFTVSPTSGYQFSVSSVVVSLQRSASGNTALALRSSVDGYAANLDTEKTVIDNTTTQTFTFTFTQANSASAVTYRIYSYAEATGGSGGPGDFTGNDIIVNGTVTPLITGIETVSPGGLWNVGSTWLGGVVPTAGQNAIINHPVVLNGNVTRNAGTTTTVNATLSTGAFTFTNNGTTTINGTFTVQGGGFATGNSFVYGPTPSTLIMNHNNATVYGINGPQAFWPVANPPYNVTIAANSPTRLDIAVGAVEGTLAISSELDVNLPNSLRVNGILRINANGNIDTNGPIYGSASTLEYRSGGIYGRSFEWNANGIGTIGVTPGYPNNVTIPIANTVLDYINGALPGAVGVKAIAGNLTISNATAALHMDYGGVSSGGELVVGGNVSNGGTITLGHSANDDLRVGGNFTNGGTFNHNNRRVIFTKTGTPAVLSVSVPTTLAYVVFQPASGSTTVQLSGTNSVTISAPDAGNAITFNSALDVFDLNSRALTIGTTGVANTITGGGTFRGSTTSSLTLLGTGSIGTLTFGAGFQNLGTFTVNRTAGAIACVMGSPLTIPNFPGVVNLTAGIVDLDAQTFTLNATTNLTGVSSSNYFIADNAFGGILRKGYTATGSFTFPIGDKTGTMEYSPATLNLTAGTGMTAASFIGMSVNDSKHPNMNATTHFISRYWSITSAGTFTAPTYSFTATYLPADVNGTEGVSQSQQWNGTAWSPTGASLGSNTLTYGGSTQPLTGTNHFSGGFRNQEINIRQGATSYPTGSTYAFGNVSAGSSTLATFTIENLGNSNLLLFSNSPVAAPFSISSTPFTYNVTIGSLGTATFTIQFAPTLAGPFSGSITFTTNDSDEGSYTINFSGTGTGSNASDILRVTNSEPTTISTTNIGVISAVTDGLEVWRFNLRDGGATVDADALPTTMTAFTITQNVNDAIGNWDESIEDVVLVDLNTATILSHGTVTTNQIQFAGLNVVAPDGGNIPLALRMTLKCPLGTNAIEGDDFGFTISNANVTFDASGSGKATFTAQSTVNSRLALVVVATKLIFSTQPITTGVSSPMSNVVVWATDACGNRDINFTGSVSITSTGTMNAVAPINAVAGSATFAGITHTVVGTDFALTATATGLTNGLSTLFDISTITILNPGDLAVLAVNTNTEYLPSPNSGQDEVVFVCFRDLLPGTNLFITDNGYERQNAGLWGGTEGVISITRTGSVLPKGTIIVIRTTVANASTGSHFDVYTCGAIDTNWTKNVIVGSGFNLNSNDDLYFMQGGVWTNNAAHTSTYTGNVLYAWTESGWNTSVGTSITGDTAWSTLYPSLECFSTVAPIGNGFVKFNDPDVVDFSSINRGKFDWIALINNQTNWNSYANNAAYVAGGYNYVGSCTNVFIDNDLYVNGKWSGRKDSNWFDCENWETLLVPDETVDVEIGSSSFTPHPIIDDQAPFAIYSGRIAKARNLLITDKKLEIIGNDDDKLEVHGNFTIANTVADDAFVMDDGQLYLYGNWINNKNNNAFNEGNGTVHFVGTSTQTINTVTPLGTESFYNVILDNNFNTSASNDLMATGNLTVSATRTLTASNGDYVRVDNRLTNNGSIVIEDDAQLIQVNDTDTNNGDYTTANRFQVRRTYTAKNIDYVYWSSPLKNYNVSGIPSGYRYSWNTTMVNPNGTMGNWTPAVGTMEMGKGYIARTFNGSATPIPLTHTFRNNAPHNGSFTTKIKRGDYDGPNYDPQPTNTVNELATKNDDNWNLVGNPYPSAIDARKFLSLNNANIFQAIWIWRHGLGVSATTDPYYYNFGYSYSPDYLMYNFMGSTDPSFTGKIASGQGFMVSMLHGTGTLLTSSPATYEADLIFNNSLRLGSIANPNEVYDNSVFFRTLNQENTSLAGDLEQRSRIWLDVLNDTSGEIDTTLLGYSSNATMGIDKPYDCVFVPRGKVSLYSLIEGKTFIIQGRALPFDFNDQVPMGLNIAQAGNHTIAIKKTDGIFDEDVTIYLEDKLIGIIHNLKEEPYHFTSTKGTFEDRFVIRYTTNSLDNQDFENSKNSVVVATKDKNITIKSYLENIDQVTIYDVLGRQLYQSKDIQNKDFIITNISSSNQSLVVKIKLQNGHIVTKKIIL